MKIKLKELVGKIVCKTTDKRIDSNDGQYPRIGWKHNRGYIMKDKDIKYKYVKIDESPHYKFVLGEKQEYLDYMNTTGWKSGRNNPKERFEALINTFDNYDPNIKYIEVVFENGLYAIVDGLHRCSILYEKNPEQEIEVNVIICRGFTKLPMLNL